MHRAFARSDFVRVARRQVEAGAAIVEEDAVFGADDAGAEIGKDRVNQADGHAIAVDGGDENGIAVDIFG